MQKGYKNISMFGQQFAVSRKRYDEIVTVLVLGIGKS